MMHKDPQSSSSQRDGVGDNIGRWMVMAAWILLLLLLTYLFSQWLDHQRNPNRHLMEYVYDDGDAELTLFRNRMGHYVAPGEINGTAVVFLLDTGATHVALPEKLAIEIGLKRGLSVASMTANGLVKSWMTELDSVRLGPFSMVGVKATIMPSMNGPEVLLGMNFLKHLELLQKGDQLVLRMPRES